MSDNRELHIEPVSPVRGAAGVQPVRPESPAGTPATQRPEPGHDSVAASTGGNLRAAYAQFVVNPDTNDVVIRIMDSETDMVLNEYPSKEVQAMSSYLQGYANTLARHRAAVQSAESAG
jgi:hypothetical protein